MWSKFEVKLGSDNKACTNLQILELPPAKFTMLQPQAFVHNVSRAS